MSQEEHPPRVLSAPPDPEVDQVGQDDPVGLGASTSKPGLNPLRPPGVDHAVVTVRRGYPVGPGTLHLVAGGAGQGRLPLGGALGRPPGGQSDRVRGVVGAFAVGQPTQHVDDPFDTQALAGHLAGYVGVPSRPTSLEGAGRRREGPAKLGVPLPHHADQNVVRERERLIELPDDLGRVRVRQPGHLGDGLYDPGIRPAGLSLVQRLLDDALLDHAAETPIEEHAPTADVVHRVERHGVKGAVAPPVPTRGHDITAPLHAGGSANHPGRLERGRRWDDRVEEHVYVDPATRPAGEGPRSQSHALGCGDDRPGEV